jgi:hypothetical protein
MADLRVVIPPIRTISRGLPRRRGGQRRVRVQRMAAPVTVGTPNGNRGSVTALVPGRSGRGRPELETHGARTNLVRVQASGFARDSPVEQRRFELVWGFSCRVVVFGLLAVLCSEVCPGKAGMFSRRQSCRGKSQSPVVRIAEEMETEPSKPIDKISRGEITSHRAVSKENALWPRKK